MRNFVISLILVLTFQPATAFELLFPVTVSDRSMVWRIDLPGSSPNGYTWNDLFTNAIADWNANSVLNWQWQLESLPDNCIRDPSGRSLRPQYRPLRHEPGLQLFRLRGIRVHLLELFGNSSGTAMPGSPTRMSSQERVNLPSSKPPSASFRTKTTRSPGPRKISTEPACTSSATPSACTTARSSHRSWVLAMVQTVSRTTTCAAPRSCSRTTAAARPTSPGRHHRERADARALHGLRVQRQRPSTAARPSGRGTRSTSSAPSCSTRVTSNPPAPFTSSYRWATSSSQSTSRANGFPGTANRRCRQRTSFDELGFADDFVILGRNSAFGGEGVDVSTWTSVEWDQVHAGERPIDGAAITGEKLGLGNGDSLSFWIAYSTADAPGVYHYGSRPLVVTWSTGPD